MLGIDALDIVIGLLFVYLLFSLFVTILNEIISSLFQIRGKELQFVIDVMITQPLRENFYSHPRIKAYSKRSLLRRLKNPLPDNKKKPRPDKEILPSSISPKDFAQILLDMCISDIEAKSEKPLEDINYDDIIAYLSTLEKEQSSINEITFLKSRVEEARINYELIRKESLSWYTHLVSELEDWYEDMMSYASEWYKRKLRFILIALGFVVAIIFNVNTFNVVENLANDPEARALIVQQAEQFIEDYHTVDGKVVAISDSAMIEFANTAEVNLFLQNKRKELLASPDSAKVDSILRAQYPTLNTIDSLSTQTRYLVEKQLAEATSILGLGWENTDKPSGFMGYIKQLLGWFITALAISLGAPFWFDMLNKVVNIRRAVQENKRST